RIFPFLPLYVKSLGSRYGLGIELLSGLVFSVQAFTMMIASPFWGNLADRLGRKIMVERSLFGGAFVLFLMAFVHSAEELVLLRGIQGLITGTLAASNALIAAEVPPQRTGYAMGLLQVGFGGGIALGPILGGLVADHYGFHSAFFVTTIMLLLSGFLVFLGIHENFEVKDRYSREKIRLIKEWHRVIKIPGVLVTYGLRFMTGLGRMVIVPIAPLFVQTLLDEPGRVNTMTGLMVGVSYATTTIGSIYFGKLGDQVGHRIIVLISIIVAGLLYFPQSFVTNVWQILVLQALVGVALGGIIPTISALLAKFTQRGEAGTVYGMDNSVNSAARSIAPLIGAGVAAWLGLRATFSATGLIFLIGGFLAILYLPKDILLKNEVSRESSN
ncbi:MAG: MFS transporter, partial [Anaerolineales bacterium]|nr:MFS transporter [Anaerolineales bacterium]